MEAARGTRRRILNSFQLVRKFPLFEDLPDDLVGEVDKVCQHRTYQKNDIILVETDSAAYMYMIYSGRVKVVQRSREGKENILAIHKKGECFGEMALLDGKTAPATVIALEDVHVGLISRHDFEHCLMQNENFRMQIIQVLCRRLRDAWELHRVVTAGDAETRVMGVLERVSSIYGVKDDRGTIIPVKLTHRDIADYSHVSRETATRLLNHLSRKGKLEVLDNRCLLLKKEFFG